MVIFYKKWKKYNEIQLTKNKMDLNIQKITNHPPSPKNNGAYIHNNTTYKIHQIIALCGVFTFSALTLSHLTICLRRKSPTFMWDCESTSAMTAMVPCSCNATSS